MKTIKDGVHDHIDVDGVARALLDTPAVQRLRHIKQLGTVHLVYPSANHSRFEHSLGVYHLACRATEHLGIHGTQAERLQAAALLHDIGHTPFSHNVEPIVSRETGRSHDDVAHLLETGPVADILDEYGLDPARIAALIAGKGRYGQLIAGELDVDRLDYLVRDAHHTGVPYGTIDHERLIRELRFADGALALAEGNVQTAESVLTARALMNPTVYNHHVARISKTMLRRGVERLIESNALDPEALVRMDDHDLLVRLRTTDETAALAGRLTHRNLFKRAVWAELRDVPTAVLEATRDEIAAYERAIAEAVGLDRSAVAVDIPGKPTMRESSSRVLVNGAVKRLDEASPLVRTLRQVNTNQWRLGVYCPAEHTEAVGRVAASILHLEGDGGLIADVTRGLYATLDRFDRTGEASEDRDT